MATPLGHCLAGAAVGLLVGGGARRRAALIGAAAGAAADLDFLPGLLVGDPGLYHHGASHSVVVELLAALAALALGRGQWRWAALVGGGYATHLLLDYLTHDDSVPRGLPLLWPFDSTVYLAEHPIFPRILHEPGAALSTHNVAAAALELVLLGPLLLVCWWAMTQRSHASRPGPGSRSGESPVRG